MSSLGQRVYDRIRRTVQWTPIPVPDEPGDRPYATHEGWVPMGEEHTLHVLQLNTGETVIEQASLDAFMNGPFGLWIVFLKEHPEWEDDVRFAPEDWEDIKPGELVASTEATKAFAQWAVDQGLAQHPERLRGYLDQLEYLSTLGRQARARRKPKLRLIRPRHEQK
jgi:hypothetical protein